MVLLKKKELDILVQVFQQVLNYYKKKDNTINIKKNKNVSRETFFV